MSAGSQNAPQALARAGELFVAVPGRDVLLIPRKSGTPQGRRDVPAALRGPCVVYNTAIERTALTFGTGVPDRSRDRFLFASRSQESAPACSLNASRRTLAGHDPEQDF